MEWGAVTAETAWGPSWVDLETPLRDTQMHAPGVHSSPKWKQPKCPSSGDGSWKGVPLHNGTSVSHRRSEVLALTVPWWAPRKIHGAKEARHRRHVVCDSVYMRCAEQNRQVQRQKVVSWWSGAGEEKSGEGVGREGRSEQGVAG